MLADILFIFYVYLVQLVYCQDAVDLDTVDLRCDYDAFEVALREIKYDKEASTMYNVLLENIQKCNAEKYSNEYVKKIKLINELLYKHGLLELSNGQELKSLRKFQEIINNYSDINDTTESLRESDPYFTLAKERYSNINSLFGNWESIDALFSLNTKREDRNLKDQSKIKELTYKNLLNEVENNLSQQNEQRNSEKIDQLFNELFQISPFNIKSRYLHINYLLAELGESIDDLSISYDLIKSYQIIIEKNSLSLSLNERRDIRLNIAIIQTFLLGVDSSRTIKSCLQLDMDFQPCKMIFSLQSKINKINPHRSLLLDSDEYKSGSYNDNSNINWNQIIKLYLLDKKPVIKLNNEEKKEFENNYKLIQKISKVMLIILFENTNIDVLNSDKFNDVELIKYIDALLCQSSTEDPDYKKLTNPYCKKALKNVMTKSQWTNFGKTLKNYEPFPIDELRNIWNNYPHLAIHAIEVILKKLDNDKFKKYGELRDELKRFFDEIGAREANNQFIKKQYENFEELQKNMYQNAHNQQQRQYQHQYQQQQQQQQQHQPPPQHGEFGNKDFYKVLSIPTSATDKEIRKAYLLLTKKYHPDKQGQLSPKQQAKNHAKMIAINEAYEILSDENKRRDYDNSRGGSRNPSQGRPGGPGGPGGQGNPFDFGNNFNFNFRF
ncbi:hypothetical protein TPHA_0I01110 [Tetrapisispora phaffii CBS 4417]|uniref:J domain-containing protein n=1 Tax=Tetrapisispora phaffii (strain ATCC 24235 / CBS 4417 / NBRC 1672 / NRRL Y-8282 / UCD 70-5) TaxID=1071381 RepID=G8BXI9_TETPH|nr:hypothetical protein TPHA_0I01110 [Tetrapisispora phaffii CBS 4417]CCE64617.1 hypothetical protein TPHA_0I01110 [Tetrapisispora phaffii CBS 4417]